MASHDAEHERLQESAGLYVLDALEPAERAAFEAHLRSCEECAAEVRSLRSVAAALPAAAPLVDPPAALRARVMAAATGRQSGSRVVAMTPRPPARTSVFSAGWLSAAALLVVSLGLGGYSLSLRQRIAGLEADLRDAVARLDRSEQQVAVATRSVASAEARMAVLTAPDLRQVNLAGQTIAPRASGRAFLSRASGLMFTASDLPPLPAGRVYQLWIVTAQAPVSAGLLEVDAGGRVAQRFDTPANLQAPVAIAVTDEPAGGVPAPTGEKYLVGATD